MADIPCSIIDKHGLCGSVVASNCLYFYSDQIKGKRKAVISPFFLLFKKFLFCLFIIFLWIHFVEYYRKNGLGPLSSIFLLNLKVTSLLNITGFQLSFLLFIFLLSFPYSPFSYSPFPSFHILLFLILLFLILPFLSSFSFSYSPFPSFHILLILPSFPLFFFASHFLLPFLFYFLPSTMLLIPPSFHPSFLHPPFSTLYFLSLFQFPPYWLSFTSFSFPLPL